MSYEKETILENVQNFNNWNRITTEGPVSKRKRFLARKIRKLMKLLKSCSKSLLMKNEKYAEAASDELERKQNAENEARERKLTADTSGRRCESDENMRNENWENWDSCYLCAGRSNCCYYAPAADRHLSLPPQSKPRQYSVCYVFMPGQAEPVPVKLRSAKIPGGVMWISYQPDVDICCGDNLYSLTSSQIPQGQRPTLV